MPDYPNDQAPDWDVLKNKQNDFSEAFPPAVDADTIKKMWDLLVTGIARQWEYVRQDRHSAKSRNQS